MKNLPSGQAAKVVGEGCNSRCRVPCTPRTVFSPIVLSEVLQNHTKMAHCYGHSIVNSHTGESSYYLNVFLEAMKGGHANSY